MPVMDTEQNKDTAKTHFPLVSESLLNICKTEVSNIQHIHTKLEAELDAKANEFGEDGFPLMLALSSTQLTS